MTENEVVRLHILCTCNARLCTESLETLSDWLAEHSAHWLRMEPEHVQQHEVAQETAQTVGVGV